MEYVKVYENISSLKMGFDRYRAFPQDEKDNSNNLAIDVPVLYLKGEQDFGDIESYVLRKTAY